MPNEYFSTLSQKIIEKTRSNEFDFADLENQKNTDDNKYTILNNKIPHPYQTDKKYFETLSTQILSQIKSEPHKISFVQSLSKIYRVAAVLLLMIVGVAVYSLIEKNKNNPTEQEIKNELAAMSIQDLENHNQIYAPFEEDNEHTIVSQVNVDNVYEHTIQLLLNHENIE